MKRILLISLLALQSLAVAEASVPVKNTAPVLSAKAPSTVILDLISAGQHLATWDNLPGAGNYTVGIINLNTNQTHSVFSTSNNSALISGLVSGNTYQFTIVKNGYIVLDVIDIG